MLAAIGLTPGGSSTVHIYTQTVYGTIQSTQTIHRSTHLTNREECGPCPIFGSYTLAFALQLREKHGKTSVRVAEECQLARWNRIYRTEHTITITIHKHNNIFFLPLWRCGPTRVRVSSFLRFLDHTQRRTTVGRTPLDAWSARRRDLYVTTHNSQQTNIYVSSGIRTHDLSRRAAVDLRFRPCGHWDRQINNI